MNTLLLQPTDTLFFRDGRPMSGSLSGHGAAWPLPTVINAALHAALHRAEFEGVHKHVPGRSSQKRDFSAENRENKGRLFGSLVSAGPFPVNPAGDWFFQRPADAQKAGSTLITLQPTTTPGTSSLPKPLAYPVGNTQPPTKDKPETWLSQEAFQHYLNQTHAPANQFLSDSDFTDTEHSIGIGISAETGTQDGERIYSAHSLRLREGWGFGILAEALDKVNGDSTNKRDLVQTLFPNNGSRTPVIVGGQQRLCTALRSNPGTLPLPTGPAITGTLVKWVLLTPAIFPSINDHPGGWLPSWVDLQGNIQLLDGPGKNYAKRHKVSEGRRIPGRLVATITGKPIPVTGYALPNSADPDRTEGGAKTTHLAVPAGSVYYFEADSKVAAQALATALNWHGCDTTPTTIKNRRSTLMGEKGFGLGVCAPWQFHNGKSPIS